MAAVPEPGAPLFSVVRGRPGEAEVAVLAAVLAAVSSARAAHSAGDPDPGQRQSHWADRARLLREASALPR